MKHIYPVCIPAPIAYIQLSETCQLSVQHAHVNQCYVEALLTQGKVSKLHVMTKNLQSIRDHERFQDCVSELNDASFDAFFVTETWRGERQFFFYNNAWTRTFLKWR